MGKMIDNRDISVVVQGKTIGETANDNNITRQVCSSIRKNLPGAEIILSTWSGENVTGIEYDKLVFNENIQANKIIRVEELTPRLNTVNHQIITTISGLKASTRKYALKLRSDLCLVSDSFLEYFKKYNNYSLNKEFSKWRIFEERIVVLPTHDVRSAKCFPFNISDWFYFGLRLDLINLFDIPLINTFKFNMRKGERYPFVEDNFGAEQCIWLGCLRKYISVDINRAMQNDEKILQESEIALVNNFVTVSASKLGVYSLKFGLNAYAAEPYLSATLYSLEDWEKLYNKYGGGNVRIKVNIRERFLKRLFIFKTTLVRRNIAIKKIYSRLTPILHKIKEHNINNKLKDL